MIIVRISGGLGNQMFQYAAGLALALHHRAEIKLDLSWFATNQLHQGFELARVFGLDHDEATAADYRQMLGWRGSGFIRPWLERRRMQWLRPAAYVSEPHFHYWKEFLDAPADTYLDGYWQSEKYFIGIAPLVRQVFNFAPPMSVWNQELGQQIQECNSVSLHVRRGDYVANPVVSGVHGVCNLDYYQTAIEEIRKRVVNPHFFIFSDDFDWAKNNLRLNHPFEFIEHNRGGESYNDMRLMSLCKHHIIANSSFSWWGAWLNPNPEKSVVAPRRWFANYPADTRDLYGDGWIRL